MLYGFKEKTVTVGTEREIELHVLELRLGHMQSLGTNRICHKLKHHLLKWELMFMIFCSTCEY